MLRSFRLLQTTPVYRLFTIFLLIAFNLTPVASYAQDLMWMPAPGVRVEISPKFEAPLLKGLTVHPENPLQFDFLIDAGDELGKAALVSNQAKKEEYRKLIKYFLSALTLPEKDMWVNLSPYEENRVIADNFSKTQMGRDLLAQDYLLKQLTASLIYPEEELGKTFWDRVYKEVEARFGKTEIPVNTFNKVWIVPSEAVVYETKDTAFIIKSRLKVMMQEDYLSMDNNRASEVLGTKDVQDGELQELSEVASKAVREIVLPAIEKEVNEGKNFALLRQIYSGMILATWYKQALKESLLGKIYMDKSKTAGVELEGQKVEGAEGQKVKETEGQKIKESESQTQNTARTTQNDQITVDQIYAQYVEAFKKGVYNYIKEDYDPVTEEVIPRKYFSGGFDSAMLVTRFPQGKLPDEYAAMLRRGLKGIDRATAILDPAGSADQAKTPSPDDDNAMLAKVAPQVEFNSTYGFKSAFDLADALAYLKELIAILSKSPVREESEIWIKMPVSAQEFLISFWQDIDFRKQVPNLEILSKNDDYLSDSMYFTILENQKDPILRYVEEKIKDWTMVQQLFEIFGDRFSLDYSAGKIVINHQRQRHEFSFDQVAEALDAVMVNIGLIGRDKKDTSQYTRLQEISVFSKAYEIHTSVSAEKFGVPKDGTASVIDVLMQFPPLDGFLKRDQEDIVVLKNQMFSLGLKLEQMRQVFKPDAPLLFRKVLDAFDNYELQGPQGRVPFYNLLWIAVPKEDAQQTENIVRAFLNFTEAPRERDRNIIKIHTSRSGVLKEDSGETIMQDADKSEVLVQFDMRDSAAVKPWIDGLPARIAQTKAFAGIVDAPLTGEQKRADALRKFLNNSFLQMGISPVSESSEDASKETDLPVKGDDQAMIVVPQLVQARAAELETAYAARRRFYESVLFGEISRKDSTMDSWPTEQDSYVTDYNSIIIISLWPVVTLSEGELALDLEQYLNRIKAAFIRGLTATAIGEGQDLGLGQQLRLHRIRALLTQLLIQEPAVANQELLAGSVAMQIQRRQPIPDEQRAFMKLMTDLESSTPGVQDVQSMSLVERLDFLDFQMAQARYLGERVSEQQKKAIDFNKIAIMQALLAYDKNNPATYWPAAIAARLLIEDDLAEDGTQLLNFLPEDTMRLVGRAIRILMNIIQEPMPPSDDSNHDSVLEANTDAVMFLLTLPEGQLTNLLFSQVSSPGRIRTKKIAQALGNEKVRVSLQLSDRMKKLYPLDLTRAAAVYNLSQREVSESDRNAAKQELEAYVTQGQKPEANPLAIIHGLIALKALVSSSDRELIDEEIEYLKDTMGRGNDLEARILAAVILVKADQATERDEEHIKTLFQENAENEDIFIFFVMNEALVRLPDMHAEITDIRPWGELVRALTTTSEMVISQLLWALQDIDQWITAINSGQEINADDVPVVDIQTTLDMGIRNLDPVVRLLLAQLIIEYKTAGDDVLKKANVSEDMVSWAYEILGLAADKLSETVQDDGATADQAMMSRNAPQVDFKFANGTKVSFPQEFALRALSALENALKNQRVRDERNIDGSVIKGQMLIDLPLEFKDFFWALWHDEEVLREMNNELREKQFVLSEYEMINFMLKIPSSLKDRLLRFLESTIKEFTMREQLFHIFGTNAVLSEDNQRVTFKDRGDEYVYSIEEVADTLKAVGDNLLNPIYGSTSSGKPAVLADAYFNRARPGSEPDIQPKDKRTILMQLLMPYIRGERHWLPIMEQEEKHIVVRVQDKFALGLALEKLLAIFKPETEQDFEKVLTAFERFSENPTVEKDNLRLALAGRSALVFIESMRSNVSLSELHFYLADSQEEFDPIDFNKVDNDKKVTDWTTLLPKKIAQIRKTAAFGQQESGDAQSSSAIEAPKSTFTPYLIGKRSINVPNRGWMNEETFEDWWGKNKSDLDIDQTQLDPSDTADERATVSLKNIWSYVLIGVMSSDLWSKSLSIIRDVANSSSIIAKERAGVLLKVMQDRGIPIPETLQEYSDYLIGLYEGRDRLLGYLPMGYPAYKVHPEALAVFLHSRLPQNHERLWELIDPVLKKSEPGIEDVLLALAAAERYVEDAKSYQELEDGGEGSENVMNQRIGLINNFIQAILSNEKYSQWRDSISYFKSMIEGVQTKPGRETKLQLMDALNTSNSLEQLEVVAQLLKVHDQLEPDVIKRLKGLALDQADSEDFIVRSLALAILVRHQKRLELLNTVQFVRWFESLFESRGSDQAMLSVPVRGFIKSNITKFRKKYGSEGLTKMSSGSPYASFINTVMRINNTDIMPEGNERLSPPLRRDLIRRLDNYLRVDTGSVVLPESVAFYNLIREVNSLNVTEERTIVPAIKAALIFMRSLLSEYDVAALNADDQIVYQKSNKNFDAGIFQNVGRAMSQIFSKLELDENSSSELLKAVEALLEFYLLRREDINTLAGILIFDNSSASPDQAQLTSESPLGGIDLYQTQDALTIKRDGNGVALPVQLQDIDNININGLVPNIIEVQPLSTPYLRQLLSLDEQNNSNSRLSALSG